MTDQPESHHVPLSLREKFMVFGLLLAFILPPLLGWWTCQTAKRSEDPVIEMFAHLQSGDYPAAFDLLSAELQSEVGSPEALGERWRAAGVTEISLTPDCTSIGVQVDIVLMDAKITRRPDATSFALGVAEGRCRRTSRRPVTARVQDGKIIGLRLSD